MIARTLVGIAALTSFGWAVGCGGSSDTIAPPPSPFATEQGFCQKLAEASCTAAVVENCYLSDPSDAAQFEEDVTTCRQEAAKPSACNPYGYAYRQEGAEACVNAVAAAYNDGKLNRDEIEAASEACLAVYSGNGGVGSTCAADHECNFADGLTCVIEVGKDPTCQVAEVVAPGSDCGAASEVCEEGYHCNAQASICGEDRAVGDTCGETQPCVEEALCNASNVCEAKASNGSACTDPNECEGGFCVKASGATSGTCGSNVTLSPTNEGTCSIFLP